MKNRRIAISLIFVLVLSCAIQISAAAYTDNHQQVLDYLNNWRYIDGDTVYSLNVSDMSEEDLAMYYAADFDDLDSLIHNYLRISIRNTPDGVSGVMPYADSGLQYGIEDFTYNGDVYRREYTWRIGATYTSSNGIITNISNTQCDVNPGQNLSVGSLTHVFSLGLNTSGITIGYSVTLIAQIGYYGQASKSTTLMYSFSA